VPRDGTLTPRRRTSGFRDSPSRPRRLRPETVSRHAFPRSLRKPQTRLTPPSCRTPPGQSADHPPGSSRSPKDTPVSMSPTTHDTSSAVHSRSSSWSPPDASPAPFPRTLTTTVSNQRSSGRFDASHRRATPKGHNLHLSQSITSRKDLPTSIPTFHVRGAPPVVDRDLTWSHLCCAARDVRSVAAMAVVGRTQAAL
jgi:hypothetical protein